MLSTSSPFPHPGSQAVFIPTGEPARILQARADGRFLIALTSRSHPYEAASGNRTVELAELADPAAPAAPAPRKRARK